MPQSHSSIILHLVFSTKNRQPFLQKGMRERVHAYMATVYRSLAPNCEAYRVGGVSDHVHLAIELPRTISVSELVKTIKVKTTGWVRSQPDFKGCSSFAWQRGYGIFSISNSHLPALERYIDEQEKHHADKSFEEEFRFLLKKHDLEWDEAYVWD